MDWNLLTDVAPSGDDIYEVTGVDWLSPMRARWSLGRFESEVAGVVLRTADRWRPIIEA